MEEKKFTPGADAWVIERNEDGEAFDVTGFVFLAEVRDMAIVSPTVGGSNDLDDIMGALADCTAREEILFVLVYPMSDLYKTREEADAAFAALDEGED